MYAFNKFKYGFKLSDKENGRVNKGVIFGTYASLIGERHSGGGKIAKSMQATRLHQLVTWCGRNFDGVIVFDECHKAKNLYQANGKPSKTGATGTGQSFVRMQILGKIHRITKLFQTRLHEVDFRA